MKEQRVEFFSDKLKLVGLLDLPERESTNRIIILCHGFAWNKDEYQNFFVRAAEFLCDSGFAVFRFDFRGHGESDGKQEDMTPTGESRDVDAAIDFVKSKGFSKIGIIGQSFGGAPALISAARNQKYISALVLWMPLLDYGKLFSCDFTWDKKYLNSENLKRLEMQGYIEAGSRKFKLGKKAVAEVKILKPYEYFKNLKIPAMIIHGDKDDHVPIETSKIISKKYGVKLETIKGLKHGGELFEEKGFPITIGFFKENLK